MEEKTDVVSSELMTLINTTYDCQNLWKKQLFEEASSKNEDLSLVRCVTHRR